jgi:predicted RNase H-related nuclease YkuK (DUF458 family)
METVQTVEHPNFETVWAVLQRTAEDHEKWKKEADERQKELVRQMQETDRKISKLGGRLGDMVEHLAAPHLVEKFGELGVVFEKAYQNARIKDKKNNIFAEADITLENSEKVMIVEVKSKLTTEDITEHIKRMEKMRVYADKHGDKRKYLGAVAAIVMTDNEKAFAFKNGFYVLEPSGETFTIAVPEGIYSVKEW